MNRHFKVGLMLMADLVALPLCFLIAMMLRVGDYHVAMRYGFTPNLCVALITIPVFAISGLYGAIIRFIDQRLLVSAGIALAAAIGLAYAFSSLFDDGRLPRSVLAIYWFVASLYVMASRLMARTMLRGRQSARRDDAAPATAVYGAGEAGSKLVHAMRLSEKYHPVCLFDDKASLDNHTVAGLKVIHSSRLTETVHDRHISLIVIATPSATSQQRREMMCRAHKAGIPVKILSNLLELADGEISTRSIRDIKIDDLLGREPIRPHADLFGKCVRGQAVLVTGAGGSIGSELCRQILTLAPSALHLLDHSEYALYRIEQELNELARRFPGQRIYAHLGSVCDMGLVERIMREGRVDTVYHAAAYKHVPLVEGNMAEGMRNNVLGAEVVASAASKFQVSTCVLVSTDKAVRPTSMMGASKRIAELIFQAAALIEKGSEKNNAKGGTTFCMVRFGNVLGSSGSVVPLFRSQIERGGPITITHPDVVRYFMSIPEAAQLVIQAGAMATGGDVFVMDMGEPVKIVDLARTMLAMCGLSEKNAANPDGDIEVRFTGLRPGEKLYEELFAGDDAIPSRHPRIMTTSEYVIDPDTLSRQIAYLILACSTNDEPMIRSLVRTLVREYSPGPGSDKATAPEPENVPGRELAAPFLRGSLHLAGKAAQRAWLK